MMKPGDFLIYTFEGDPANPPNAFAAEIVSVDTANSFFTFRQLDTGTVYTFQYSAATSGPWQGQDSQGDGYTIATHDVYTASEADPVAQEVALVTFADGRYLCMVQSIDPTVDIIFYQQPCPMMSLNGLTITQSDWDAHPAGGEIISIQRSVLNDDLGPGPDAKGVFTNGWWSLATQTPAFAGRIGGVIAPFAVVVHTTDMVPESWRGLVHSWTTQIGDGACAHFLIGRDPAAGIIQLAPITRNSNHAGDGGEPNPAKQHGWFVASGNRWHPNTVSVGIELHCAGILHHVNGEWWLLESGAPQGAAIPEDDVILDPIRPGVAYHTVTDYQYTQLGLLLDGLETVLGALPAGCVAQSVEQPPPYGRFATGRRVGHVTLHAYARGDPWPATCNWMRTRI